MSDRTRTLMAVIVSFILTLAALWYFGPDLYRTYQSGWSWDFVRQASKLIGASAYITVLTLYIRNGSDDDFVSNCIVLVLITIMAAASLHHLPLLIEMYQQGQVGKRFVGDAVKLASVVFSLGFMLHVFLDFRNNVVRGENG